MRGFLLRLRLHAQELHSLANGPGVRAVAWFQGCSLGCPGCFDPLTHEPSGGFEADTAELADRWLALGPSIEGVTISGGEPLEQPEALLDLLERLRPSGGSSTRPPRLGVILFSGFTRREIDAIPLGRRVIDPLAGLVDAAILGRYVASRHVGRSLLGSANQEITLLTTRYQLDDFQRIPLAEVRLGRDGTMAATGIAPIAWPRVRNVDDPKSPEVIP